MSTQSDQTLRDDTLKMQAIQSCQFPTATFTLASTIPLDQAATGGGTVSKTVQGNLTLHGVTKSISFPATVTVKDGGVSLASEFALNRRDFGINYPGMQNDLIRDEVVIKLDVKAPKKA